MFSHFRPWLDAWVESAYGAEGFWRTARPRDHFRTSSSSTSGLVVAITALLAEHPEIRQVVELGAGDGLLLSGLSASGTQLSMTGVDLRPRPEGLTPSVGWCVDLCDVNARSWRAGAAQGLLTAIDEPTLVLAVEWLDDLPTTVASAASSAWQTVEVDPNGTERLGEPVVKADREWLEKWWPLGGRAEVGRTRDAAWASVLSQLRTVGGLALAIDYGHLRSCRPSVGSLQAFRGGREVPPTPGLDRNLTAAVAMDSLAAAGLRVGASTLFCRRQSDVLAAAPAGATEDPLAALVGRSEQAALVNPAVWGDQWWLLQQLPAH